jgi:hypothetical protein
MNKFAEKELEILRRTVDMAEKIQGKTIINSPEIQQIIHIVEAFLRDTKCVCYGGTAINNILPIQSQFYNKEVEIPDYDFYSTSALNHAKQLADIYVAEGFTEVEAKAGMHHGTYKVFVNFIPVADISQLSDEVFKKMDKESIKIDGILYAPPNFLRMGMYLELSRPKGDVSRWEKVLKRLILLNQHYPLGVKNCHSSELQRRFHKNLDTMESLYSVILNSFTSMGLIFFGGYANAMYSKYMPKRLRGSLQKIPDFDVLSEDPKRSATILKERLTEHNYKNITITKRDNIGEIVANHYEIKVGKETVAFIYKPLACHSYNILRIHGTTIKIATIDTMLSFYLAFIYSNRPYYDDDRILCMAHKLFVVQQKNRLKQKGLLKRFSLKCYGEQSTLETMRLEKSTKYKELERGSKAFEEWFLKYAPGESNVKRKKKQPNKKTKHKKGHTKHKTKKQK